MGFFSRRRQAESALSPSAGSLSSEEDIGELNADSGGIVDPLAAGPADASGVEFSGMTEFDPNDPIAAMRAAQEAMANSPLGSGPLGHYVEKRMAEAMEQTEASMRAAQAYAPPGGFPAAAATAAGSAAVGAGETVSQLERLAVLRASGALTEDEFAEQKRKVLGEG